MMAHMATQKQVKKKKKEHHNTRTRCQKEKRTWRNWFHDLREEAEIGGTTNHVIEYVATQKQEKEKKKEHCNTRMRCQEEKRTWRTWRYD